MDKERLEMEARYRYLGKLKLEGFLWEFLRRNEEYKKLYAEYKNIKRNFNKLNWDEISRDEKCKDFRIKLNKFGLTYPIDPSKQANDKEFKEIPRVYFRKNDAVDFLCWHDDPDRMSCWNDEKKHYKIAVLIDARASYRKIESDIKRIVKNAKGNLKKTKQKQKNSSHTSREIVKRFGRQWQEYIMAYDLKHGEKYGIRTIAHMLYPDEDDFYPDFKASKKIARYIKEAKKLINIHYKDFLS